MISRREYVELHNIEWDYNHSLCSECEYGQNNTCKHENCPNGGEN